MNVITRGVKNAFRNGVRSGAVILILALGIGLSLSMLVANEAVKGRIEQLKTEMGTTLTVNPAGMSGMEGGGTPLTNDDVEQIAGIDHIDSVNATASSQVQTEGTQGPPTMGEPQETDLESAVDPGDLTIRTPSGSGGLPDDFAMPITVTGISSGDTDSNGELLDIIQGDALTEDDEGENVALLGKELAEENDLKAGSTFEAFGEEFTVAGIFDQGTLFDNNAAYMPLTTVQELSDQEDEVQSVLANVDSIDNLAAAQEAIESTLGEDDVDVTSTQGDVEAAIASLQSVQTISIVGFVATLIAAAAIIFMVMIMVVRERRREIGVLKAIGASNLTVVKQFMVEAMILIVIGASVGTGLAVVGSSGITNAMVSSSSSSGEQSGGPMTSGPGGGGGRGGPVMKGPGGGGSANMGGVKPGADPSEVVGDVAASVGVATLLYGLLSAIVIAGVGAALPAWFIAKIRPVEVLRGE